MPPRLPIDGRLDIPEDLSVAFRVLCNAAKSDKARIQQLEVELARLSHRSEAAEAANGQLQAQLKQLQGIQKQKDELSEQLEQLKEEVGKREGKLSEQLSRQAEGHEKELLQLQATLSQHKMDLVMAQHQLASLKQQRQHELQMLQQQYKTEVSQLQQDAASARQQQQSDMQQQMERMQQQHQVEVLRLQQQLADALGKAKSAEASVKHIREVLSVHTKMGQQLSSLLMNSTQDMQYTNPLADRRLSCFSTASSGPVSPRDNRPKCASPTPSARTQQLSPSLISLMQKDKLTRRRSDASPVRCTHAGAAIAAAAGAAADKQQQQQQQDGKQEKQQQVNVSTGPTFKLLTKYSSLHREATAGASTAAAMPAAAAAPSATAAAPTPEDSLSVVASATFLALPPNHPSLSQLASSAESEAKSTVNRASQATEALLRSAEQANPLFSISSTRPLVSGDYVPLGGHSSAAEGAVKLGDKPLQPQLASGAATMPFAQPAAGPRSLQQLQQQLKTAEQHRGVEAAALRRQQAGRSLLTQPAGRKQGEQQQTRLSKTTLHTAPGSLSPRILASVKEAGPAVPTIDDRIQTLVQMQRGEQQQQLRHEQQEEQLRLLQHLGMDLAAQWVEKQGMYTQSSSMSPRRPGKRAPTLQPARTKYEQLLQQQRHQQQQQQQQQQQERPTKKKEDSGPGMMMYRWSRRFSSGHACAEDLE